MKAFTYSVSCWGLGWFLLGAGGALGARASDDGLLRFAEQLDQFYVGNGAAEWLSREEQALQGVGLYSVETPEEGSRDTGRVTGRVIGKNGFCRVAGRFGVDFARAALRAAGNTEGLAALERRVKDRGLSAVVAVRPMKGEPADCPPLRAAMLLRSGGMYQADARGVSYLTLKQRLRRYVDLDATDPDRGSCQRFGRLGFDPSLKRLEDFMGGAWRRGAEDGMLPPAEVVALLRAEKARIRASASSEISPDEEYVTRCWYVKAAYSLRDGRVLWVNLDYGD